VLLSLISCLCFSFSFLYLLTCILFMFWSCLLMCIMGIIINLVKLNLICKRIQMVQWQEREKQLQRALTSQIGMIEDASKLKISNQFEIGWRVLMMCREWFENRQQWIWRKWMKDGSGCVVFLLVFRLDYSDFKVNKMEDRLEWYFDKSIWTPQRSI